MKFNKVIALMLCIATTVAFTTGCTNNNKLEEEQVKKEEVKEEVEPEKLQIEKIEKEATGTVSQGDWSLWDKNNNTTKEGRSATGENAMVTSGKYEASQAGIDIIEAGGNAIDAAVATGFALCVVEPNATGVAGGGCMVIRNAEGEDVYIDFRESAPADANPDMWELNPDGTVVDLENIYGGKSVAIPGQVAGLIHAFEKYGSGNVTLEEVMTPAINLAQNGFYVTPMLKKDMLVVEEMMKEYKGLKSLILKENGSYYDVGELYKNQDLADTLKLIAKEGKDAFYKGDMAEAMVEVTQENGGILTLEDLANYEVVEKEPVEGTYRGKKIISSPLSSSGGTHIIQALNILENFDVSKDEENSAQRYHLLSEIFKMVYQDRAKYMGDPEFIDVPIKGLTNKDYAKELSKKIDMEKSQEYKADDPWIYEHEDTTHYSVADKEGNMVAVTQTINWTFGSGLVVDDYGFVLNNEMADFAPYADSPNSVEGGKIPLSSMSPTIILNEDDTPFMVLGSPGGLRIIPAITQVISNVIDYDMGIQEAIDTYRMFDNTDNKIVYEGGLSTDTATELINMGHTIEKHIDGYSKYFGGVQGIQYKNGQMIGGADSRRDGKAIGN